jgi:D-aminopeptidase
MSVDNINTGEKRARIRELGIKIGRLEPGPLNAITDVSGVLVGHETIVFGDAHEDVVDGIARTGVTVVYPRRNIWDDHVYAGSYILNGNGDMTGLLWIEESGLLTTPIALTNTNSVGLVRDSIISWFFERYPKTANKWIMPVVAETWDGYLNDLNGMHVSKKHIYRALDNASSGTVEEGSVGGGTGMTCYEFKGGIGTSSRMVPLGSQIYSVGTLVQANYGHRYQLIVNGVPVGEEITKEEVPGRIDLQDPEEYYPQEGSIIILIATDVPLLADQCKRLARRAAMGLARVGSYSGVSGDSFLAFSTGNTIKADWSSYVNKTNNCDILESENICPSSVQTISHDAMSLFFEAVVESVEESIINALCTANTVTGIRNQVAYALPLDRLVAILKKYNRA